MKDALNDSANMSGDSVDLILKAIDDMQGKINAETDEKLKDLVDKNMLEDLENELKATSRRVGHNEGLLKTVKGDTEKNAELIESARKKMSRMQADLDNLKRNQGSALSLHESPSKVLEEPS